jgi:hypothetical protein
MGGSHHQSEIGHVDAGRVRVTGERETGDDLTAVLGHVHGSMGVPAQRFEVPPLVGHAAPAVARDQPALGLLAHGRGQVDELLGVVCPRLANPPCHETTIP